MEEKTQNQKKYFYKPEHNKGSKRFTSKVKGSFYRHMYGIYKQLQQNVEDLGRIEQRLYEYDGSEYAILECKNLKKYLESKAKPAIERYNNRINSFKK